MSSKPTGIDQYISGFPKEVQQALQQVRDAVRAEAPEAVETIKYAIPSFVQHGNLVHFAAFKNHIGFYPLPSGMEAFQEQLSRYKQGKGSVQFPLSEPMPLELIRAIVRFRLAESIKPGGREQRTD